MISMTKSASTKPSAKARDRSEVSGARPSCREDLDSGNRCLFFALLVRALKGSVGRAVPEFGERSHNWRVQVDDFVPHCIQH